MQHGLLSGPSPGFSSRGAKNQKEGPKTDRGSGTLCPSMAHISSDGHVGYIVYPQRVGSNKKPGMPSQYLVRPKVAIFRRIHLWEGKSASNRPCESSNTSPDHCGKEPWILLALWGRANVVTAGTFLGRVCPVVGCPGRNSRRPGLPWVGADVPTAREETGCFLWVVQQSKVVGCCPVAQALTVGGCCNPSWHVGNWSRQRTDWGVGTSGWSLEWVASVEVCRGWQSCNLRRLHTTT